jgi:hypothetical protein
MRAKDYIGYFLHTHNNDKCLFITRGINHHDITLRPVIDFINEKKPECVLYNHHTEGAVEWLTSSWDEKIQFKLNPDFYELEKTLLDNNCKLYLVLGCHEPELFKEYDNLIKNFKILYWPTYLISHTFDGLKDLYLYPRGLDGKLKVDDLSINKRFDKLYLNFNNKPRYHRCVMMDQLYLNDLYNDGINTWNIKLEEQGIFDILVNERHMKYDFKYWKEEHLKIDGYKIKERGFADEYTDMILDPGCFMALVGESSKDIPFVTEKTYRSIFLEHPFLCYGAKNQNKEITKYGFQLYDEIFNYSFDGLDDINDRIEGVIQNLKRIKGKNYYDLYEMLLPKIKANKQRALQLREDDSEFNPYVEFYKKYGPDSQNKELDGGGF